MQLLKIWHLWIQIQNSHGFSSYQILQEVSWIITLTSNNKSIYFSIKNWRTFIFFPLRVFSFVAVESSFSSVTYIVITVWYQQGSHFVVVIVVSGTLTYCSYLVRQLLRPPWLMFSYIYDDVNYITFVKKKSKVE